MDSAHFSLKPSTLTIEVVDEAMDHARLRVPFKISSMARFDCMKMRLITLASSLVHSFGNKQ